MKIRSDSSFMMRGERSYLRQRGLRRKTVFPLSCPTEGVVVINMKNILRQKVSAGIFGASLLGSLFFGGAAQAADDLTVLTSFGLHLVQLVVMGSEQSARMAFGILMQIFYDGPSYRDTIVGTSAST